MNLIRERAGYMCNAWDNLHTNIKETTMQTHRSVFTHVRCREALFRTVSVVAVRLIIIFFKINMRLQMTGNMCSNILTQYYSNTVNNHYKKSWSAVKQNTLLFYLVLLCRGTWKLNVQYNIVTVKEVVKYMKEIKHNSGLIDHGWFIFWKSVLVFQV